MISSTAIKRWQASAPLEKLLRIELTTTHKEMATGIGADKTAFVIEELGTANGTKLPPGFLLFCLCRFTLAHDCLLGAIWKKSIVMVSCNRIELG